MHKKYENKIKEFVMVIISRSSHFQSPVCVDTSYAVVRPSRFVEALFRLIPTPPFPYARAIALVCAYFAAPVRR